MPNEVRVSDKAAATHIAHMIGTHRVMGAKMNGELRLGGEREMTGGATERLVSHVTPPDERKK